MQPEDLATARFRAALPAVLQPASPALAAFHATRARLALHPAPDADVLKTTNCMRCGAYLLDGSGAVRVVRRALGKGRGRGRGRPYVRVLRRSCALCGCDEDLPLEKSAPKREARAGAAASLATAPVPSGAAKTGSVQSAGASTPLAAQSRLSSAAPSNQLSRTPSAAPSRQSSQAPTSQPTPVPSSASGKASASSKASLAPAQNPLDARAKTRPKKKTGLQDMLARNRERQEQEMKAASGGLAAFLQDL
ncbi:hypothetical protein PsYK624_010990 [Phanerochaete sordida]|uniref:Rpr2-domain-containing protein n=1 Tax=Phanerochaete sordida TaxID=48140 RepID=A0A9P3FYU3_9APHY|nr:hypothetical protein PsYK624_010990 [Phanerochaete sordida]